MIRTGVICPSEIAARRFLPALQASHNIKFIGVAHANKNEFIGATDEIIASEHRKAESIISQYGGKIFESYQSILESKEIDAIYLPLPPGLHFQWAKCAIEAGKHILVEKPFTTDFKETSELIQLASSKGLAVHENYMFIYHNQIEEINKIVSSGEIGDVRLYRISFGFPLRQTNDFRYNKALGGGALLDCGGYTLKYASLLLGQSARLVYSQMNNIPGYSVDMYGSAALVNDDGVTAQVAFGMDNDYRCELEVWGSKGTLRTGRVLTAPSGFIPTYSISKNGQINEGTLSDDDAFLKSIERFVMSINDKNTRLDNYDEIYKHSYLVDSFINSI